MNPGSNATALPRGPGLLLPKISKIRADTSVVQSPTGKMTGDGKLTTQTPASPRPKEKDEARKRKKTARTSKVSNHPSVVIASSWTDRQEQVEEMRAREAIYLSQRSDAVTVDTVDTHDTSKAWWIESVRIDKAGSKPRARRPWEWSAQDCETLLVDALSRPKDAAELSLEEILGIEDESAAPRSSCDTKPASLPWDVPGERSYPTRAANVLHGEKKNAEELSRERPPARRFRGRCNGSTGMRTVDALGSSSGANGQGEVEASTVSTDDSPSAMEQEGVPVKRKKNGYTPYSSADDKGNVQKDDSKIRPPDTLPDDSSGKVDAIEDEKKAREISAALNRNIPRRGRFQQTPDIPEGEHDSESLDVEANHAGSKERRKSVQVETDGKERRSKRNSCGKSKRSASLMRKRLAIDTGAPGGTNAVPFDPTAPRNELEVHPWISAGLEFGLGTMAEVWWDDGKWYKCRISKISYEGRCGELEFLPYRRKIIAREFSTELDLDKLIREGHLVLPGTHLLRTEN